MHRKKLLETVFITSAFLFAFAFISGLYILQYPQWWKWLVYEQVPLTWLESSLLLACSFFSFICFIFCYKENKKDKVFWFLLTGSFLLFAFDERFAVHERFRDKIIAPADIRIPFITWTSPGDYILLFVMAAGLIMFFRLIRLFRYRKMTYVFFITAVSLSAAAVIMDSFDMTGYPVFYQRTEQFIEEIIETSAMLFFMNTFFLCSIDHIYENFKSN
ncbi:MAG: hypothetical protein JW982_07160 [Spirochaetes bacterium]|nr:hypothetical protein [Spirochaetota bacterium]